MSTEMKDPAVQMKDAANRPEADPPAPPAGMDAEALEALSALGTSPTLLSPAQRRALDEDGYVVFEGLIPPDRLRLLQDRFDALIREEGEKAGTEFEKEEGSNRLSNLVDKGEVFDIAWSHPLVLACAWQVFGRPFKLSSLNAREALPGHGWQSIHADWGPLPPDYPYLVANSLWLLDDFTPNNGGTRLVPGTHAKRVHPPKDQVPGQIFEGEIRPVLPAGTVIFINAHLWHGGTKNVSGERRRVLHGYFCARNLAQQQNQKKLLRDETQARLSAAERWILGL